MASRTAFTVNQSAMRQVLTGPQSEAVTLLRKAQRQTINTAKLRAPVDTGQLRAGHVAGPITIAGSRVTADVTATQEYAAAVHDGRKATIIRPKRAQMLSWVGPQGRVFARSVTQPARKGRPWLLNATKTTAAALGFEVTDGG